MLKKLQSAREANGLVLAEIARLRGESESLENYTKKILLIRAFVGHPKLVLLEEPTITLNDSQIDELRELAGEKVNDLIIFARIETSEAIYNFDSILEKSDGIIIQQGGGGI
jgi:ABC-type molybdenum transport system ATPase subunit/photorepair protein PhrA